MLLFVMIYFSGYEPMNIKHIDTYIETMLETALLSLIHLIMLSIFLPNQNMR